MSYWLFTHVSHFVVHKIRAFKLTCDRKRSLERRYREGGDPVFKKVIGKHGFGVGVGVGGGGCSFKTCVNFSLLLSFLFWCSRCK